MMGGVGGADRRLLVAYGSSNVSYLPFHSIMLGGGSLHDLRT